MYRFVVVVMVDHWRQRTHTDILHVGNEVSERHDEFLITDGVQYMGVFRRQRRPLAAAVTSYKTRCQYLTVQLSNLVSIQTLKLFLNFRLFKI